MKVLIIAEIRLYREGVADALRRLDDIGTVVTAATGDAAVLAAREGECDVALMDMALADSAEVVVALLMVRPSLRVVALGVAEDGPQVITCAEAGVSGYISREASLAEVGDALRRTVRGEAPISGAVAAGLLRHIACHARTRNAGRDLHLTVRERQVLQLLQQGMTNRQIAKSLDLQLSTVKNHVHHVLAKLGVVRRAEV